MVRKTKTKTRRGCRCNRSKKHKGGKASHMKAHSSSSIRISDMQPIARRPSRQTNRAPDAITHQVQFNVNSPTIDAHNRRQFITQMRMGRPLPRPDPLNMVRMEHNENAANDHTPNSVVLSFVTPNNPYLQDTINHVISIMQDMLIPHNQNQSMQLRIYYGDQFIESRVV